MIEYNPKEIEKKWQKNWENDKPNRAVDGSDKPKFYGLVEFPYPSGNGLHVGHARAFTSIEIISRKRRLEGYNVLFPIGWDAFGLPTENYAIQTGQHPRVVTDKNIQIFLKQLKSIGYSFDYDRMVDTTEPDYYKWTQWIFIQLFKRGLAYKSKTYVNFCPECKVILANEESQGGVCDRCSSVVEQLEKDVWFLKIRDYADSLLEGLNGLDFPPRIKTEQENWIGKSRGAEIDFEVVADKNSKSRGEKLRVFTTRPDTIFGATFMVIAPEHPILDANKDNIDNLTEIEEYRRKSRLKNEFERVQLNKEKTGVKINGISAINPLTGKRIPVFAADYVMMGYGTGAIMAVPAHDTRDWEFARVYKLPVVEVIQGGNVQQEAYTDISSGTLVNSDFLNGLSVQAAIDKMIEHIAGKGIGEEKTNFNMKDWAFNRQRYWGEPIPIVYCNKCGYVAVPEAELPVMLPKLDNYKPTTTCESPLSTIEEFVNCKCPECGGAARRETDTMPQWAGSSWYFLRYIDPKNKKALADKAKLDYWGQVDWYNGGMEHVTRHLIYSRFWNQFLYDIGVIPYREPYKKRSAQGLVLGEDGEKMSKSRGNVVNPNELVENFGADAFRLYMMFMGDYEKAVPWSSNGIKGTKRFLDRVWKLGESVSGDTYSEKHMTITHKLIKKVSSDIEELKFNTAIAAMMEYLNAIISDGYISKEEYRTLLILLSPFAPHIVSELLESNGFGSLYEAKWPSYDESKTIEASIEIPVQINGKVKAIVKIALNAELEAVKESVYKNETIISATKGMNIVKEIYIPNKIFNIIIK